MGNLERTKAYQKRLVDAGLCVKCRNPVESERLGKYRCRGCSKLDVQRVRQWKKDHPDKVKAHSRSYYAKNSSKEQSRMKEWELSNKEHMIVVRKINKYKYKHRKSVAGKFSLLEWESMLSEYGYKCLWCGGTQDITVDHVIPLVRGGSNYIENIQPLCRTCNSKKYNKIIDFRTFGSFILEWT